LNTSGLSDFLYRTLLENFPYSFDDILSNIKSWFVYDPKHPLLFNSSLFLGMFLVFYLVYIFTKKHTYFRTVYVGLFSLFFYYKAGGEYFILLVLSSALNYFLADQIYKREKQQRIKLCFLVISIIANLGFLGYFKYTNFLIDSFNHLFSGRLQFQDIILPIGISFYTFQTMSYTIDVYRNEIAPAKSFLDFTFFVCFFPQLVAGPIVRAKDFIPQIYQKITLTKKETSFALFLIIGGLLKKAVISDYISINFVDRIFDAPNSYTPFENLMAVYGYSLQIYCDFSGYSDMAIGLALLMGFTLPENFRTPYQSKNITEFWHRWHISLSTWLKDYLYIPLGGNRQGSFCGYLFPFAFFAGALAWAILEKPISSIPLIIVLGSIILLAYSILLSPNRKKSLRSHSNQLTTMLLGGLWHGASLRFIIWGALHGFALALHKSFREIFPEKSDKNSFTSRRILPIIYTFITFHFVAFCWIFFRAKDFSIAMNVIENIGKVTFDPHQWKVIIEGYRNIFLLLVIGFIWHFFPAKWNLFLKNSFEKTPLIGKALILAFVFWIVYATASTGPQPFIYFQF
jgi:alginate O-acetylation protein